MPCWAPMTEPTPELAARLAARLTDAPIAGVRRFPTGLTHWVYEVTPAHGAPLVIRIAAPGMKPRMVGAVAWNRLLRPLGVPLPALLGEGAEGPHGWMALERLPGADLGAVIAELPAPRQAALAAELTRIQNRLAAALGPGSGYGYVTAPGRNCPHASWPDMLAAQLARGRRRLAQSGLDPDGLVDRAATRLESARPLLAAQPPTPFLHDITTRNVIIHEGALSGIVDVDEICYGDPMLPVALTRMSLLLAGEDTSYADMWEAARGGAPAPVMAAYMGLYLVDFLSEEGGAFNGQGPRAPGRLDRLRALAARLLPP